MGQAAQLNIVPVYGGQEMEKQLRRFQKPVDVVVGTPGRIMDHMERGTLNLEHVQVAILDEADRMLDMGFVDDVVGILRHSPPTRQTALFSATMPREVLNIAYEFMKSPQSVNVTPPDHLTVEKISQYYVQVDARTRPRALRLLLQQRKPSLALVFCRTKRGAERVGQQLKVDGFRAKALHGDLTQKQRDEAMAHFREGKLHVMVATDIASRGLDVFDVSHVINYDLPEDHLTYVHRIGRTGRMGANGEAISFVFPDQAQIMAEWAKSIGTTIKELKVDGLPSPESGAMGGVPAAAPMGYGSSGFGGETQTHERRPYGSGFGRGGQGGSFGRGREGGSSGGRPFGHGGERREGGFGRGPREGRSSSGSGFGGRGGGRGGPRDGGSGFGGSAGAGRSPISPLTMKKIKERPIGAAKSHGHTRGGHQYAGRQD
ncbi:MAG: DEAD/DEAH box helicase [Candidatus Marsarchaeota archaeon]|nr:DEAD/DEAH box helicase [Candidatus Marsarchaeota archaeon]